jgi:hypothetical protein
VRSGDPVISADQEGEQQQGGRDAGFGVLASPQKQSVEAGWLANS